MEKVSDGVSERFLPPPPVAAIALGNEWPHCPCSSLQTSDDRMARAGLYPPDLLSTHLAQGPGFGTTAAHGGEAVTRKLHTAYKVCWAPARVTQAWPHTITLYSLCPNSSQSTNDTGPHGAFINLPDHMEKQADEHLRVTPQETSKASPATKPACPTACFS